MDEKEDRIKVAIINGPEGVVGRYLPSNYSTIPTPHGIIVWGRDFRGWTLDGYVLPRLASGWYFPHPNLFVGVAQEPPLPGQSGNATFYVYDEVNGDGNPVFEYQIDV